VHEVERSLDLARAVRLRAAAGDRGALAIRRLLPTPIGGEYVSCIPARRRPGALGAAGTPRSSTPLVSEGPGGSWSPARRPSGA